MAMIFMWNLLMVLPMFQTGRHHHPIRLTILLLTQCQIIILEWSSFVMTMQLFVMFLPKPIMAVLAQIDLLTTDLEQGRWQLQVTHLVTLEEQKLNQENTIHLDLHSVLKALWTTILIILQVWTSLIVKVLQRLQIPNKENFLPLYGVMVVLLVMQK